MSTVDLELSLTLVSLPQGPQTTFIKSVPVPWLTLQAHKISETSLCRAGEDVVI